MFSGCVPANGYNHGAGVLELMNFFFVLTMTNVVTLYRHIHVYSPFTDGDIEGGVRKMVTMIEQ